MWFNVDGTLIPKCQTIIVDHFERVVRKELGRIRRGHSADVVAVARELERGGGVFSQCLLKQDLCRFRLQCRDMRILEDCSEMNDWITGQP